MKSNRATSSAPATPPAREQRAEPRQPEARPAWLQRGSNTVSVEMVDISRSGACFVSQRPMDIGRSVRLQIGYGTTQMLLDGSVVRYRSRPDGLHEVAIRLEIDAGAFERLRRFPRHAKVIL